MSKSGGIRAGRAFVELFADDSKLVRGLKAAQARLQAFGASVSAVGRKMALLGGAALAPMLGAAKVFSSFGDQVAKMAKRTGLSVETLSELRFVASQTGTEFASLEMAFRKMQRSIYDAGRGLSTQKDALADLGLTFEDLQHLSPEEQFKLLADRLGKLTDDTKQAAIAQSLFGRTGTNLIPMFEAGAEGISKLQKEARRLGLTMSSQDAKAAEDFTDAMDAMGKTIKMSAFHLGAALAPALQSAGQSLTSAAQAATGWIKQNRDVIVGAMKFAAVVTAGGVALLGVGKIIQGASLALKAVGVVLGVVTSPLALIVGGLAAVAGALAYTGLAGETFAEKMNSLKSLILPAVQATTEFIRNAWASLAAFLVPVVQETTEAIRAAWGGIVTFVTPVVQAFTRFVTTAFAALWDTLKPLVEGTRDMILQAWSFLAPCIAPVLNWLRDAVVTAFAAAAFAIQNWRALLEYSFVAAAYHLIKFANQAQHFLTVAVPGYLAWFRDNWRDVFQTIWNGIKTFTVNVWKNLKNLWNAIVDLFQGKGWNFQWTGLMDGFESAIKELPKIAEREIGPLEKQLGDHVRKLGEELSQDWKKTRKEFEVSETIESPTRNPAPPTGASGASPAVAAIENAAETLKGIGRDVGGATKDAEIKSLGTFNAAAVRGLFGGTAAERMAGGIEKIEKNTRPLKNSQGLAFS